MIERCEFCGKPVSQYPNWIIFGGGTRQAHVGCLADALEKAEAKLADTEPVLRAAEAWAGDQADSYGTHDALFKAVAAFKERQEVVAQGGTGSAAKSVTCNPDG